MGDSGDRGGLRNQMLLVTRSWVSICGEERNQSGERSGEINPSGNKMVNTPVLGSGEMRISLLSRISEMGFSSCWIVTNG